MLVKDSLKFGRKYNLILKPKSLFVREMNMSNINIKILNEKEKGDEDIYFKRQDDQALHKL